MSIAEHIANFAADELVSTRKELRNVEDRYEKLYNEHENLKEAMIEMEKKLRELEQIVASQDEELTRLRKGEEEWSSERILREIEDEWARAYPDEDRIKQLNAKYDSNCRQKSGF